MNKVRKVLSVILIAVMLLPVGCTNKGSNEVLNEIKYVDEDAPWFDTAIVEDDPVDIGCPISYSNVAMMRDDYYIEFAQGYTYDSWQNCCVLYKYDYSGSLIGRFDVEGALDPENTEYIEYRFVKMYVYNDVEYYVIEKDVTDEVTWDYTVSYLICTIDYDANEYVIIEEKTFADVFPGHITVSDVAVSGDYVVYLLLSMSEYSFYVENKTDGTSYHADVNLGSDYQYCDFYSLYCRPDESNDGLIYYEVARDLDSAYYSFDPTTGVYREVNKVDVSFGLVMADGYIVYALDDYCIYRSNIATGGDADVIFDARDCAITVACANVMDLVAYNGKNIIIRGDKVSDGIQASKYYVITPSDTNPHAGKQIVTIGYSDYVSPNVQQMIIDNNMNVDSKYYIEIVNTYDFTLDWEVGANYKELIAKSNDEFINDVRSGHGPDIMIGGDKYAVANPGFVYVDLNEYINGSDLFTRENFSDVVFDAYNVDGHLYNLPFGVTLNGLAVTASMFDATGFTYDEYINHVNVHNYGNDALMNICWDPEEPDKMYYFERLFRLEFNDYISGNKFNITEGEQGEQFRALAEFVNNRDVLYRSEGGEAIVLQNQESFSFSDYVSINEAKVRNYVGYPSYDGESTCFTDDEYTVSVTTCCADKEAAWSVVTEFFSYSTQAYTSTMIPVRLDALNDICDSFISGITANPEDYYIDWDTSKSDLNEYKYEFIYLVKNMKTAVYCDPMIMLIISEELPAYFEGQKSLEEVAKVIENRVNNYMSEVYS